MIQSIAASTGLPTDLLKLLADAIGERHVSTDPQDLLAQSRSAFPLDTKEIYLGRRPANYLAVVSPGTTSEVAAVVRLCAERRLPMVPYGGGSGICAGTKATVPALAIDTKRLCHLEVSERNNLVRAGAGLFWQELEDYLAARGWTSGHFPQSMQSATVGGMASTRGVGTFSGKYGKMDDIVLAVEVVLPSGEIVRTPDYGDGVFPAPKRSCGPELRELFVGAEGAFGIITEALLTIYPRPETRLWDTVTFPSTMTALHALQEVHQGDYIPALVRLYDEDEAEHRLADLGYEREQALLLLGYEGDDHLCRLQQQRVAAICTRYGGRPRGPEGAERWYQRRLGTGLLVGVLREDGGVADAIEVSAPWDRLADLWTAMREALQPLCDAVHCHFSHLYRTGGSVYVIFTSTSADDPEAGISHYRRCLEAALDACVSAGGSISHHHGVGRSKAPWMDREHGPAMDLLRQIKRLIDPEGLMNPGVLGLP